MMQGNENKCSSMLGLISFSSYDDQGLCGAEARRHCCPSHMIAQVHTKTQNHSPAFFFPPFPLLALPSPRLVYSPSKDQNLQEEQIRSVRRLHTPCKRLTEAL